MKERVLVEGEKVAAVEQLLERLVAEQKAELCGELPAPMTDTRKGLRAWLKASKVFRQVYLEALDFHLMPRSDAELAEFKRRFVGRTFQELAFRFLLAKLPVDQVLLTPGQTLAFYKALYPETEQTAHPLGLDSLEGISVPDGLIVGNGRSILAACEYTVNAKEYRLETRNLGLTIAQKNFPQFFDGALLVILAPEGTSLRRFLKKYQFQLMELPFTHAQFRNFVDGLYKHYSTAEDSATLSEVQQRAREQLKI